MPKAETENSETELTPKETLRLLLENELDYVCVSICSSSSSVVVKKEGSTLLLLTGLDYNGELVNNFRFYLQDIDSLPNVSIISVEKSIDHGLSKSIREIEITSSCKERKRYRVTSMGISNKFNRLTIE